VDWLIPGATSCEKSISWCPVIDDVSLAMWSSLMLLLLPLLLPLLPNDRSSSGGES